MAVKRKDPPAGGPVLRQQDPFSAASAEEVEVQDVTEELQETAKSEEAVEQPKESGKPVDATVLMVVCRGRFPIRDPESGVMFNPGRTTEVRKDQVTGWMRCQRAALPIPVLEWKDD